MSELPKLSLSYNPSWMEPPEALRAREAAERLYTHPDKKVREAAEMTLTALDFYRFFLEDVDMAERIPQ
jgi:hypothetical protein